MAQIEALFDAELWPNWKDPIHPQEYICHLRHGQLCEDLGLAYDWLYPFLSERQRQSIVDGVDRYAVQPYLQMVSEGAKHRQFFHRMNNVTICIRGGLGTIGMAMGNDHPQSRRLIDLASEHITSYGHVYGPEGSYNESVSYSVSTMTVVRYLQAGRYWAAVHGEADSDADPLGTWPYPEFCRWLMYFTLPPGREAALGDGDALRMICLYYFPAIAAAARDGVLQWHYLNNLYPTELTEDIRRYPLEVLWYDPELKPLSPEGRMPHGHAFDANNMCVSSRTNWDPKATPCVVYGKGGVGKSPHNHLDAGQVCIDGYGQRLIVDASGWSGSYAAVRYHNILMFDGRDMVEDPDLRAKFLASEFDDRRGGYWRVDTSALYEGGVRVTRTVVHLNPSIVAVLDDAMLPQSHDVSLRWHTIGRAEPDQQGRFLVHGEKDATLASRVVCIDPPREQGPLKMSYQRGDGRRNPQPFCEVLLPAQKSRVRLLSLFCVFEPGVAPQSWQWYGRRKPAALGTASIKTPDGVVEVNLADRELTVRRRDQEGFSWSVPV